MNKVALGQPAASQIGKPIADSFGNLLQPQHIEHLISEGFASQDIIAMLGLGVRSITASEAMLRGFKVWVNGQWKSGSGIYFPFNSNGFAQVRLDEPIIREDGSIAKYLTPYKATASAYIPPGCQVITEGYKDAAAGSLHGKIPTGAIAGVSHYRKALPEGIGYTTLFDSDGWHNPNVFSNLFHAGLWLKGKIQLLPSIKRQPKAGLCEYFKYGYNAEDYQELIEKAYAPKELLLEWPNRWQRLPDKRLSHAIRVALTLAVEHLDLLEQETLLQRIKKTTKLNLSTLRTALAKAQLKYNQKCQKLAAKPLAKSKGSFGTSSQNELEPNSWNAPESYNGQIGFWRSNKQGDRTFEAACNFDFIIERELADSKGGGFILQVKRSFDEHPVRIILNSVDHTTPDKFTDALKRALNTSVVCNLTKHELNALIHTRLEDYRLNRKGKVLRRIERYGQQPDGIWVIKGYEISPDGSWKLGIRQYTKEGKLTTEEATGWVFADVSSEGDEIACPELAPADPAALKHLVDAARKFFGQENIHQVLLMLGWVVAGLYSQVIFQQERCFALFNAFGVPGSCKTLGGETALSVIGVNWPEMGMLAKASQSAIYEHGSKTASLPFFLDDPERDPQYEEVMKVWYNRKARVVRGNRQVPQSPMGVITNHVVGAEQAAAYTRFVRAAFESGRNSASGDNAAFQELQTAQRLASGAFPTLLKIGYPREEIFQIEKELLLHLPKAHARIAKSLAITVFYAQKIVELADGKEDVKKWAIANLCPTENDGDSVGDSLQDFIEKVLSLESESLVGDWNKQRITAKDGTQWIALHYADVWNLVDVKFKPATYNLKSLKPLIIKAGGRVNNCIEKFDTSRDESLTYYRALITNGTNSKLTPPRKTNRKAWLLPASLFGEVDNSESKEETLAKDLQFPPEEVTNSLNEMPTQSVDNALETALQTISDRLKLVETLSDRLAVDEEAKNLGLPDNWKKLVRPLLDAETIAKLKAIKQMAKTQTKSSESTQKQGENNS